MNSSSFTYTLYIGVSQEQVWEGLTDPELTVRYWAHRNISSWKVGSSWEHRRPQGEQRVDITGDIIECDPPHRLVHSWTFTGSPHRAAVFFDIEKVSDNVTRLTLTHENLEHDMERYVWPKVLSGLKTLLETGKSLPGLMS